MLEVRPSCEQCNKSLAADSTIAMICTYECTFCSDCVTNVLFNVCPNCSGGFEKRPIRPKDGLVKNPVSSKVIFKPIDKNIFSLLLRLNKDVLPKDR